MASANDSQVVLFQEHDDVQALIERNKKTGWPDIEPFQKAFAYSFIINYDHRDAAKAAGRPPKTGIQILRTPLVAAFIESLQEQQATNSFITKEYITTQYMNMIPKLMGEEEVPIMLPNGKQVEGKRFYPGELRSVLAELSKTVDGFDKNKDQGGSKGGVTVNLNLADLVGRDNVVIEDGEIVDD